MHIKELFLGFLLFLGVSNLSSSEIQEFNGTVSILNNYSCCGIFHNNPIGVISWDFWHSELNVPHFHYWNLFFENKKDNNLLFRLTPGDLSRDKTDRSAYWNFGTKYSCFLYVKIELDTVDLELFKYQPVLKCYLPLLAFIKGDKSFMCSNEKIELLLDLKENKGKLGTYKFILELDKTFDRNALSKFYAGYIDHVNSMGAPTG